jgi:hypothetical protein
MGSTPNSSTRHRSNKGRRPRLEEDDAMMTDEDESNSIATTMGVKADNHGSFVTRNLQDLESTNGSVAGNSLVLPRPLGQDEGDDMEDDDISTLTEYSMEEEDDTGSQATHNTAWTVITTGTDSTTVPTRNFPSLEEMKRKSRANGKRSKFKEGTLLSNSQFKRRRLA